MAEENVESNEIRTRNILAKFQDGSTPSLTPDEVDFLIERIATGNGKYVSGSFIGIYRSQLVELISNRLASMDRSICEDVCSKIKLVQYTTANLVPQSEMVADTVLSSEKINDYGLLEALKENDKLNKKVDDNNEWVKLQTAVEKAVVEGGISEEDKIKLINNLKEARAQENVGKSKIRKIDKMVKKLDPEYYFGNEYTRVRHNIPEGAYRLLADAQRSESKQKNKALKVKRLQSYLEESEKLWEDDAKDPWTWKNIGHKLKNKMNKIKLTVKLQHPNLLAKRIAKRENISSLNDRMTLLDAKIKEQQRRIDGGLLTPRQEKDVRSQIRIWNNMYESYSKNKRIKDDALKEKLGSLQKDTKDRKPCKDVDRIRKVLESRAKDLQKLAKERLEENSYWQVIESLDIPSDQKSELRGDNVKIEEFYTAPKILEAILKERGYSDEQQQEILATFFPAENVDSKTKEKDRIDNQNTAEIGDVGLKDEKSKALHEALELDEKNNDKIAKALEKDGWVKGKNGSEYTRTTEKGETQVINFLYNPEDKKYSIDTLDKDGGSRPATKDDYKALAIVMKENGISSVTITDLQDKDLENAIEGLKEAGVKVENIDEVKDRIDKYKKEEKTENATNEAESTAKSRAEKGKETTVVVEKGETEQDSQSKPETGNATKEKAQAESKGKPDASKTTKKDDINLVNVTNYIKGLRIDGRAEMEAKGEKTVKFKDLSDAEKKLARQLHAHRMNIIKQAKAKGLSDKDIEAVATAGTVGWLKGHLSGTKSTPKRNKQINALAKANVSKAMESSKINKDR